MTKKINVGILEIVHNVLYYLGKKMAGLENHINENELNETGKVEAIKKVIEKVNSEVNDAYINTLSGLDKTKVSEAIKNLIQNSDWSYKTNQQINRKDSWYQFLVQVALQLLYPNETNLLWDREIDAEYWQATRNAVAKFQWENGIQVDGDAGIQTLRAMKEILAGNTISDEVKNIYTTPQANIRDAEVVAKSWAEKWEYMTKLANGKFSIPDWNKKELSVVVWKTNLYTREGKGWKYSMGTDWKLYYVVAANEKVTSPIAIFDWKKWTYSDQIEIGKLPKELQPSYKEYTDKRAAESKKLKEDNWKLSFTFNDVTVSLSRNDFISSWVNFLGITIDPKQKDKTIEDNIKKQIQSTINKIDAEIAFGNSAENKLSYMFAINKDNFLSWEKKYNEIYNNKNSNMNIKEKKDFSSQGISAKPDVTFYDALGKNYSRSVLERIATWKENWKWFKSWVPSNPEKSTLWDYILEKSINTLLK